LGGGHLAERLQRGGEVALASGSEATEARIALVLTR
jgi:hypothetical protein